MASVFSKIIAGEIPCYFIGEDAENYAFLDISPVQMGHVLVVPKVEKDRFFDLSPQQLTSLMLFAQRVAKAIKNVIVCDRVGVTVIGLEVPHAHVHLIPIKELGDMNFSGPRETYSQEEMASIALKINKKLL